MFLLIILVTIASVRANKNLCDTKDSVDITNGELLSNGTILSNGILYPPKHVYFNNETLRTYGCVCKVKNCVRKCCSIGSVMYMNATFKSCAYLPDEGIMMNRGFNLHYVNRVKKNVKLNDSDFGYVYGKPCDDVYLEDKSWFLQEVSQYNELSIGTYTLQKIDFRVDSRLNNQTMHDGTMLKEF